MSEFSNTILWPPAPAQPTLSGRQIHVFALSLETDAEILRQCAEILSSQERERAARFKFDQHRRRFTIARAWMRTILGRYIGVHPATIEFQYSAKGKPSLRSATTTCGAASVRPDPQTLARPAAFAKVTAEECDSLSHRMGEGRDEGRSISYKPQIGPHTLHFNLSHSAEIAVLGVTRVGEIGVDVEFIRPVDRMDELVARFFSIRETESFKPVPIADKPGAFFNLWTRKEAWLKATGEGITGSLAEVEVSFLPGELARLIALGKDNEEARHWTLHAFKPAPGYVGALAVRARDVAIEFWNSQI